MLENEYESRLGFDFLHHGDYIYDELQYIIEAALDDNGCEFLGMDCYSLDDSHGYSYLNLADDEHISGCDVAFAHNGDYEEDLIARAILDELEWSGCQELGDVMFGDDA